jgi:starch phosphorylase
MVDVRRAAPRGRNRRGLLERRMAQRHWGNAFEAMPRNHAEGGLVLATPPPGNPPAREEEIEEFKATVLAKLTLAVGKDAAAATARDWFVATALSLRDRVIHRWLAGDREAQARGRKRVYYLSLEFLIGRLLEDVICNLHLDPVVRAALGDLGVDLDMVRAAEPDAALGNGGLGRLAACFMESMASLGIPACGYGIRYDHGLFRQVIKDGWQQEYPEDWLSFGNPWEFERPEAIYDIHYGGRVEQVRSRQGHVRAVWRPAETVEAVAYDTPMVGWGGRQVNPLRLWSARAADPLRLDVFNKGDHVAALAEQARAEALSKILYPSDNTPAGRELRLRQEYFLVSAALQDLVERHSRAYGSLYSLPAYAAIQLNDTHPALAVAELMRLLLDLHHIAWEEAWRITVATISYTNHTLLPEALETWPVPLFERLLPRHLEIIYRINTENLEIARQRAGDDPDLLAAVSLIDEENGRSVRMANLAFFGSHRVNGVSALHTELMRKTVFGPFHRLHPDRIVNKTNGINFRRWLGQSNPALTRLLEEACCGVLEEPRSLERLRRRADDGAFRARLGAIKRANKLALAHRVKEELGLRLDPGALFDVQIKRIHEYKRQLLNLMEAIGRWRAIRAEPDRDWVPRVKIIAGKAAAGYAQAKLIIKLINDVAAVVNRDPLVGDRLRIAFLPNYNVSLAQIIIPAADLSEQISTAGMEASGTGNMKLALNGALTIGTLDGANIEIRDHVGEDNIVIFGLRAEEVAARRREGLDASTAIGASPALAGVLEDLASGVFSPGEPGRFADLAESLRCADPYMVAADFASYCEAQARIDALWRDQAAWRKTCLLNIAGMGWFSSDRAIAEYAEDIWNVPV